MELIRSARVDDLIAAVPAGQGLSVNWLTGPANIDALDVGLVTLDPGAAARPHSHDGGQLIVVVSGSGWVETASERIWIGPGDVVLTPPDELHTHGAADDGPMAHLTVTTGGFKRPSSTDPGSSAEPPRT